MESHLENIQHFTQHLQQLVPTIQHCQFSTVDGLSLYSSYHNQDDDQIAALSALLNTAAESFTRSFDLNGQPNIVITIGSSAYLITKLNPEILLGLQVPAEHSQAQLQQTVNNAINYYHQSFSVLH